VRNKIDLIQGLTKDGNGIHSIPSNEQRDRINKPLKDMVNRPFKQRNELLFTIYEQQFTISATKGEGFDELLEQLGQFAKTYLEGAESAVVTRERHRRALENALAALQRALVPGLAHNEDILAEELRVAARALGRLTGRVDVEEVLDVIFRDFCIGK
jgi:tRNA modification GTPase